MAVMKFLFRKLDSHMHEVVRGASVALVIKFLGALLAMVFQVVLARMLGAEDAGRYILALTCMTFAAVLGSVGLDSVLVRYVAISSSLGQWHSVASVRRNAMRIAIPASIFLTAVLFASADWIAIVVFKDKSLGLYIRIMVLAVPFWVIASLHSEMLRGLKRVGQYQMLQSVALPIITIAGLVLFGYEYGLAGQAACYVFASLFAMLLAIVWWKQAVPSTLTEGKEISGKELLRSGLPLMWAASMFYLNAWVATIVLGIYGSPVDVAMFNAANKLAWAISFVLLSVNSIAAPKFAALYKSGSPGELQRTAVQTTRLMMLVALPLMALCFVLPELFLGIFGNEFIAAAVALQILIFGQMINVMTGSVGQILTMTGHEKDLRNVITSGALLNTVLAVVLVQQYGLNGVAWSVAVSVSYTSIAATVLVWLRLKIGIHIFCGLVKDRTL